jgi:hypothetical protein
MSPRRPSIEGKLFDRWTKLAVDLGYSRRGGRSKLLDLLLAYAAEHPDLFMRR